MKQKIGVHINYWNGTGAECDPQELLSLAACIGADAMDFGTSLALNMTPQERLTYAQSAKAAGIALTLNGGRNDADLSHPDAAVRADGLEKCCRALDAAAELGSPVWTGVIYAKWLDLPNGLLTREAKVHMWDRAVGSLQVLCTYAKALGIDICIEIVNRFEAYMINTADDGLRFADDVGAENLKLLLDAFHMNIEEDCSAAALERAVRAGRLGHLHISESNRRLPGLRQTDIDWGKLLQPVAQSDYRGSIILESMVLSQSPAAHSFRTWRDMTDTPDKQGLICDAKKSIQFIRSLLCNTIPA